MPTSEQKKLIFNKLEYYPSETQAYIHDCLERIRLVAGGERSGKSYSSAMELLSHVFEGTLFWLVAADYERTRAEYQYICEGLEKLIGASSFTFTKHVDPGEIVIPKLGIRIVTKSAKDPRKLAMEAPDGILGCEASQLDYETFLRLRGRIAEKRGWVLLSGTFESSLGYYPELFNRWISENAEGARSFSLPTWSNLAIYPGGREDLEIKALEAASSPEWFMERYGGVPCPPKGLVFNEFRVHLHVGTGAGFDFKPSELVYLFVDPGFASAYAVLAVQKDGENLRIIDEVFVKGLITSDVIKLCKQKPWWNKVIGGAVDVAARQHQAQPAVSEIWQREAGIHLRSQRIFIRDGIEAVKRFLLVNPITNKTLLSINTKCKGIISELGGCPNPIDGQTKVYKWREDREGSVIGEEPEDRNNHACKALAYGIIDLFGYSGIRRVAKLKFF